MMHGYEQHACPGSFVPLSNTFDEPGHLLHDASDPPRLEEKEKRADTGPSHGVNDSRLMLSRHSLSILLAQH